jgi:hypothetical protein
VREGLGDMFLADDFAESLRPVLSGDDFVTHVEKKFITARANVPSALRVRNPKVKCSNQWSELDTPTIRPLTPTSPHRMGREFSELIRTLRRKIGKNEARCPGRFCTPPHRQGNTLLTAIIWSAN